MTAHNLLTLSGTASSSQDFVVIMDNIMVNVYGWELAVKAVDTAGIKEYWWRSEGETPGSRMTLYCGLLASGTNIYTRAATYVNPVTSGVRDTMSATSVSAIVPWTANKKFWSCGNRDFVHFFGDAAGSHHAGGFGYLSTFYDYAEDPYPACAYGQSATTSTFADTRRLLAYTASPLAIATQSGVAGGGFLSPITASGSFSSYVADDYSTILQLNAPSLRNNRYTALRKVFYIETATSLSLREIRGDLPYLWHVWNGPLFIGEPVTGSGFMFDSEEISNSEKYICVNETGQLDNTYLIGPTDEFDLSEKGFLYTISGTKLFLEGSRGIERSGGSFRGGRVERWRDQSNSPILERKTRNDARQLAAVNRPVPTSSGTFGSPHDVVTLVSGSQYYLTGTVPVATPGATTFVVARYRDGTTRTPIINIRGNLSAQDTMFALEFNETSQNSATIINTAAGGTDRVEITGLSNNTYYIVTNLVSGTDSSLFVNGSQVGSNVIDNAKGTPAVSGTLNYSVGVNLLSAGAVGSSYASADVAEIIYLQKPVTNQERNTIHCYLSEKYNISVAEAC